MRNKRLNFVSFFNKIKLELIFIVIILIFALLCHSFYLFTKYVFILDDTDSIKQSIYFVNFLQKSFLANQFSWSWSYGLGGPVFAGFSFYYSTSPFFYLMVFIKYLGIGSWDLINMLQWRLIFSISKQFLCMALMFILFRYENKKRYTSLIGAVIYGGCITFISFTVGNDFMIDAYVWIPLTVLGYLIYRKTKSPWILLLGLVLTVINSFYFGYISFIFYAIFIVVFVEFRGTTVINRIRCIINYFKPYVCFFILSIGIAAVFFMPSIYAFLNCDRFITKYIIPKVFPISFFLQLPEKLFFSADILGLPLIALIIFFLPWKQLSSIAKRKTILAGICFLFYIIPYFYSVFSGFSYMSNRWFYIVVFSIAYALPDWLESNDKNKNIGVSFLFITYIFFALCFYTKSMRGLEKINYLIDPLICTLGFIAILTLVLKKYTLDYKKIFRLNIAFCTSIILALLFNFVFYSICAGSITQSTFKSYSLQSVEEAKMYSDLTPQNNDFFRVINRDNVIENAPLVYGYYGASTYNSLVDVNIYEWMKRDFNVLETYLSFNRFNNFDDRLFLESAFGVKYITTKKSNLFKPYGFTLKSQTENFNVYENQYSLGIDSWYENAVSTDTFNSWNVAQRDAMLLKTVVLPDNLSEDYSKPSISNVTTQLNVDWSQVKFVNAEYNNGALYIKDSASFELPIENSFKNKDGEIILQMNLRPQDGRLFKINVNGKETIKTQETGKWTYPIDNYTFRLDGKTDTIKCTLTAGTYEIKSLNVWFNSYEQYIDSVKSLNKYNLQNLYVNGGTVKGTFENQTKGVLVLNIPYCDGWKATVNGKSQAIVKVNGAFSGLLLDPGKYVVDFEYETPGLKLGATISAISLILLAIVYFIRKKRMRTHRAIMSHDETLNVD